MLQACRSSACTAVAELDGYVSRASCEDLASALRACAGLAAEHHAQIEGVRLLLSGSRPSVSSAALSMQGGSASTGEPRVPPPVPPRGPRGRLHPAEPAQGERGMAGAPASVSSVTKGNPTSEKLVTWHDSREDQELAQRAQVERIRCNRNRGAGMAEVLVNTAQRFAPGPLQVEVRAPQAVFFLTAGAAHEPSDALGARAGAVRSDTLCSRHPGLPSMHSDGGAAPTLWPSCA